MIAPAIPYRLNEAIDRELEPRERVVWAGIPRRVFFTPSSTGAFLFGIPWTAFAIFWTASAGAGSWFAGGGFSWVNLFPLFDVPFILVGLAMLSSPLRAFFQSGRTVYVITDRRAIIIEAARSTTVRSYPPDKLKDLYRTEKADGSGDVIITRHAWRDSDGDQQREEHGFLRVRDVREVERRLRALANTGQAGPD